MGERIQTPTSATGIMRFYDVNTGGPTIDGRAVVVGAVVIIFLIKILATVIKVG